jgi:hypothetical protein
MKTTNENAVVNQDIPASEMPAEVLVKAKRGPEDTMIFLLAFSSTANENGNLDLTSRSSLDGPSDEIIAGLVATMENNEDIAELLFEAVKEYKIKQLAAKFGLDHKLDN